MQQLPDLQTGVYRHYKGPHYLVLGYGHDANEADRSVVVYVGLQVDGARPGPRLAVRTVEDFLATVNPATGETQSEWDGTTGNSPVPRFQYVGPTLAG